MVLWVVWCDHEVRQIWPSIFGCDRMSLMKVPCFGLIYVIALGRCLYSEEERRVKMGNSEKAGKAVRCGL